MENSDISLFNNIYKSTTDNKILEECFKKLDVSIGCNEKVKPVKTRKKFQVDHKRAVQLGYDGGNKSDEFVFSELEELINPLYLNDSSWLEFLKNIGWLSYMGVIHPNKSTIIFKPKDDEIKKLIEKLKQFAKDNNVKYESLEYYKLLASTNTIIRRMIANRFHGNTDEPYQISDIIEGKKTKRINGRGEEIWVVSNDKGKTFLISATEDMKNPFKSSPIARLQFGGVVLNGFPYIDGLPEIAFDGVENEGPKKKMSKKMKKSLKFNNIGDRKKYARKLMINRLNHYYNENPYSLDDAAYMFVADIYKNAKNKDNKAVIEKLYNPDYINCAYKLVFNDELQTNLPLDNNDFNDWLGETEAMKIHNLQLVKNHKLKKNEFNREYAAQAINKLYNNYKSKAKTKTSNNSHDSIKKYIIDLKNTYKQLNVSERSILPDIATAFTKEGLMNGEENIIQNAFDLCEILRNEEEYSKLESEIEKISPLVKKIDLSIKNHPFCTAFSSEIIPVLKFFSPLNEKEELKDEDSESSDDEMDISAFSDEEEEEFSDFEEESSESKKSTADEQPEPIKSPVEQQDDKVESSESTTEETEEENEVINKKEITKKPKSKNKEAPTPQPKSKAGLKRGKKKQKSPK
jgi:hypothetical protein